MGGANAEEKTGCNKNKGNGWPPMDDVHIVKWLAMVDVKGTATEERH